MTPTSPLPTRRTDLAPGFTLIEMLVVLTIIGLVAAVAINALPRSHGYAQDAKLAAQLSKIIADARVQAALSGRPVNLDLGGAALWDKNVVSRSARNDQTGLILYPDGSTSGGVISVGSRPAWTLDWFGGALREVR